MVVCVVLFFCIFVSTNIWSYLMGIRVIVSFVFGLMCSVCFLFIVVSVRGLLVMVCLLVWF